MKKRLYNDREKWCPGHQKWLPLEAFHKCRSHPSGRKSRCKACWREQNTPHIKRYLQGMTDEELLALWEEQGEKCAVCRDPIPFGNRRASHIDRDPATREVRGMLCSRCKIGIRCLQGSQVLLTAAIAYLRRFELKRKERKREC
jgi:hypothetical protein